VDAAELAVVVAARPGERLDLERAIAALPDGYRTVLVLHDVEGFTHPEIGERLDISVGTSRSQLFRARRTLRRLPARAGHPDRIPARGRRRRPGADGGLVLSR